VWFRIFGKKNLQSIQREMKSMRKQVSSGSAPAQRIGFSRAVRMGCHIWVAGTAPIAEDGRCAAKGDVYGQTRRCLEIIQAALHATGADLADVVRTRVMLTDIATWSEAARAHGDVFSTIRPVSTFVGVEAFIDPNWMVEIEVDAMVQEDEFVSRSVELRAATPA
jgi:enamine deaminase RidA (YjgF/YER057c/UK114 family)